MLFIGQGGYETRLLQGSSQVPSPTRVLAVVTQRNIEEPQTPTSGSGLRRIQNDFVVEALNLAFNPLLQIDWELIPTNYLPVDHESEDWEFAERLIPELLIRIQEGGSIVKIDELGTALIGLWPYFVADYKKQMQARVIHILKIAAQTRFRQFISYGGKGKPKGELRLNVPASLQRIPPR